MKEMTDKTRALKTKLYAFLRKRSAIREFEKAFKEDNINNDIIDSYFERRNERGTDCITCAFTWDTTVDGHKYWSKINSEWLKECKE